MAIVLPEHKFHKPKHEPILMQALAKIMDLKDPLDEARKKLQDTYMVVNGKILYIKEFFTGTNQLLSINEDTGDGTLIDVLTLDVFLPEAGLYQLSSGNLLCLSKIPKRQWLKSFSRTYYNSDVLGTVTQETRPILDILYQKPQKIAVNSIGNIYFLQTKIGVVKNAKEFICLDLNFAQELIDWNNSK